MRRNERTHKRIIPRGEGCRITAREGFTSPLTAGEKRVLVLLSSAKTNKEIASALGISPATVKRHLENVLRKLQLRNRVEAAIYGLTVNGCPHNSDSSCPLELWQKTRNNGTTWAI